MAAAAFELAAAGSSAHGSRRLALQSGATVARAPLRPWSPCRAHPFETLARPAAFARPGPTVKLEDEGPQESYVATRWYRAPELICSYFTRHSGLKSEFDAGAGGSEPASNLAGETAAWARISILIFPIERGVYRCPWFVP